uniref:O-fucosyltransferase family protein n=1 Tax=Aegilops tauschii subsp. strangulata TaxID=200361 RepID=A0A453R8E1_AEGTS
HSGLSSNRYVMPLPYPGCSMQLLSFQSSCTVMSGWTKGFGNRLSFDPIPFQLQRLRCRCNFHALRFVHKIQETGALLVERLHGHMPHLSPLQDNLLGHFAGKSVPGGNRNGSSKYLAVHLRFEIDMVAYSMCYFGGGKDEEEELEMYRQIHFPALTEIKR